MRGATLPFQNDLFNLQIVDALSEAGNVDSAVADYRETGRLMFALAISEPDGGSDVMSMKTSTRTLDGKIVLNGRKSYVNNGEYAPYIVVAAIDADAQTDDSYPALALWLVLEISRASPPFPSTRSAKTCFRSPRCRSRMSS